MLVIVLVISEWGAPTKEKSKITITSTSTITTKENESPLSPEPVGPPLFSIAVERPVQSLVVMVLAVAGRVAIAAEEPAATPAPKRERLISPHVAKMLADVSARQQPPAAATETSGASAAGQRVPSEERDVPANGIVRLSPYLVRDSKWLPSREDVMTRAAVEQMAMEKYFGEETSLYRVMNMVSPVHLWRKIPVLGRHPFMIGQFNGPGSGPASGEYTNEDRARARYEKDRMTERWNDLMGLVPPAERARVINPEAPTPLK